MNEVGERGATQQGCCFYEGWWGPRGEEDEEKHGRERETGQHLGRRRMLINHPQKPEQSLLKAGKWPQTLFLRDNRGDPVSYGSVADSDRRRGGS